MVKKTRKWLVLAWLDSERDGVYDGMLSGGGACGREMNSLINHTQVNNQ